MRTQETSPRKLVRDLMTVGVQTCPMQMPIADIARLLLDKGLEGIVVLDEEGHGVGVINRDDLVRAYSRDDAASLTAEDVMSEDIPELPPDIPLAVAAQIMRDRQWRVVFLLHNAAGIIYPAASISYTHFLRHLAAHSDDDLRDLGIKAERQPPLEAFKQRRDAARRRD